MRRQYVLAVDQSTQGTKAILFDEGGSWSAVQTYHINS